MCLLLGAQRERVTVSRVPNLDLSAGAAAGEVGAVRSEAHTRHRRLVTPHTSVDKLQVTWQVIDTVARLDRCECISVTSDHILEKLCFYRLDFRAALLLLNIF